MSEITPKYVEFLKGGINLSFFESRNYKTEFLGKVFINQMHFENEEEWLLKRISPICENCSKNKYFNFNKSYEVNLPFEVNIIYNIACPECGETFELEIEEFQILEPFITLNKKHENGKISERAYKEQEQKIMDRLKRKISR